MSRLHLLLQIDTSLPFVKSITALTRLPDGAWTEYVRVQQMDDYIGANARFVRNPRLTASDSGIVYLDAVKERTLIGWMYGGIKSQAEDVLARNQGSSASLDLFEVWLDPTPPGSGYWLSTAGAPLIAEP